MLQTALIAMLSEAALGRIDRLIDQVAGSRDRQAGLLLKHLQSAQTYLLGALPDEYEFSLVSVKEVASELSDASLKKVVTQEVAVLLDQMATARTHSTVTPPRRHGIRIVEKGEKSELYRFFQGSATTLGVFYPTHYIFASFPSFGHAKNAARALQAAHYRDVVAASAAETFQFMNEIRADAGVWGAVMASISRFFGTEEVFADISLAKAGEGAGFLAIYCPREEYAEQIRDLVAPFEPMAMQLYLTSGVQSLLAGKSPGPQGNHPEEN